MVLHSVLCRLPNRDVVMAVILCDDTHTGPVLFMVVRVVRHKFLRVGLVEPEGLNRVL